MLWSIMSELAQNSLHPSIGGIIVIILELIDLSSQELGDVTMLVLVINFVITSLVEITIIAKLGDVMVYYA